MKMKSILLTAFAASAFAVGSAQANILISGASDLKLYTDTGVFIKNYATDLNNAQGVAVDSAGNAFVSDWGNKRIRMYDANGTFVRDVMDNTYSGGSTPYGLSVDSSGNVFASVVLGNAPTINQLIKWNPASPNTVIAYGNYGPTYEGLYYDAPNNRLLTTLQAAVIQSFDGTTLANTDGGPLSANARGLTVGPGGNIFAGDLGGVVWQTTSNLDGPATFAYAPFNGSFNDVKFFNDQFYVTRSGALQWYDTSWNMLGSASVTSPSYMAYTSVPEPATWALLALGLTAVVTLGRRRSA